MTYSKPAATNQLTNYNGHAQPSDLPCHASAMILFLFISLGCNPRMVGLLWRTLAGVDVGSHDGKILTSPQSHISTVRTYPLMN